MKESDYVFVTQEVLREVWAVAGLSTKERREHEKPLNAFIVERLRNQADIGRITDEAVAWLRSRVDPISVSKQAER